MKLTVEISVFEAELSGWRLSLGRRGGEDALDGGGGADAGCQQGIDQHNAGVDRDHPWKKKCRGKKEESAERKVKRLPQATKATLESVTHAETSLGNLPWMPEHEGEQAVTSNARPTRRKAKQSTAVSEESAARGKKIRALPVGGDDEK